MEYTFENREGSVNLTVENGNIDIELKYLDSGIASEISELLGKLDLKLGKYIDFQCVDLSKNKDLAKRLIPMVRLAEYYRIRYTSMLKFLYQGFIDAYFDVNTSTFYISIENYKIFTEEFIPLMLIEPYLSSSEFRLMLKGETPIIIYNRVSFGRELKFIHKESFLRYIATRYLTYYVDDSERTKFWGEVLNSKITEEMSYFSRGFTLSIKDDNTSVNLKDYPFDIVRVVYNNLDTVPEDEVYWNSYWSIRSALEKVRDKELLSSIQDAVQPIISSHLQYSDAHEVSINSVDELVEYLNSTGNKYKRRRTTNSTDIDSALERMSISYNDFIKLTVQGKMFDPIIVYDMVFVKDKEVSNFLRNYVSARVIKEFLGLNAYNEIKLRTYSSILYEVEIFDLYLSCSVALSVYNRNRQSFYKFIERTAFEGLSVDVIRKRVSLYYDVELKNKKSIEVKRDATFTENTVKLIVNDRNIPATITKRGKELTIFINKDNSSKYQSLTDLDDVQKYFIAKAILSGDIDLKYLGFNSDGSIRNVGVSNSSWNNLNKSLVNLTSMRNTLRDIRVKMSKEVIKKYRSVYKSYLIREVSVIYNENEKTIFIVFGKAIDYAIFKSDSVLFMVDFTKER